LSSCLLHLKVLQVNLSTVFTISRDFGRHMLSTRGGVSGEEPPSHAQGDEQYGGKGRGKIINVASLISFQGEFSMVENEEGERKANYSRLIVQVD
jgi:2-deoxy-D-gluconate 3-dehydrogenase